MHALRFLIALTGTGLMIACGPAEPPPGAEPEAAGAEETGEQMLIRGELHYLERIALAPDSEAITELRLSGEFDDRLLAVSGEDLGDRQVPIPFELVVDLDAVPESRMLTFRGGIRSHPGPLRVSDAIEIEPRATEVDLGPIRLRPAAEAAFGVLYVCGDRQVTFGTLGEFERLIVNGDVFDLESEVAASGARYTAVDGSETEFWSRGEQAMVTVNGEVLPDCERLRAPSLPVRALGHEPSWLILMDEEAISLTLDFGARQIDFPYVEPELSASGFLYQTEADDQSLTLMLERQACPDSMADVAYPMRAQLRLDDEEFSGCAGAPIDVLTGGEWFIERIGDAEVVPGTQPTIEFRIEEGEARFSGLASCNRYMGRFELTGEGITLSPAASTMMACADEDQAAQERRLTGLLDEVYGFGVDEDGRLILRATGRTIVASR